MDEKKIRLFKSSNCIMAEFTVGGRPDRKMVEILGTHIVETAYTSDASLVVAGRDIGERNPGYVVTYFLS